jgi:adenylate cyclase
MTRQYAEAIEAFKHITAPDQSHHSFLAASCAQLDDGAAAKAHTDAVLKQQPDFTVSGYLATLHYNRKSDLDHHREGLLKAGLPE